MRTSAVLAMAIATVSFCFASGEIHKANIIDYPIGEFAVKGFVDQHLNELVVIPVSTEVTKANFSQDTRIEFTVVGCADHAGGGAKNDSLAKSRADEVAANLSAKFPGAKFTVFSKGDEPNSRMVTVTWKFVTPSKIKNQQAGISLLTVVLCFGSLVILVIAAVLVVSSLRNKRATLQASHGTNVIAMRAREEEVGVASVEWMGEVYSMSVSRVNGFWMTPFPTKSGDGCIPRKDFPDVGGSLRSYLKKSEYRPMIDRLIAEGKIQRREIA